MRWRLTDGVPDEEVRCLHLGRSPAPVLASRGRLPPYDPADSLHLIGKGTFGVRIMTPLVEGVRRGGETPCCSFDEQATHRGTRRCSTSELGISSPRQTYTICETPVPAGFTSFWKLDGVIVTPYNPDASKSPPEDLGTRCYGFSASPGQARAFEVDNSRPGGDPRTIGYWRNWNRCTGGNQSATAQNNGGAAAGFFLVEDLLPQTIGDFSVTSCQQAVKLLSKHDQAGKSKASDAAYELAAQLLAARFNLGAGAETCSAAQQAVLDGQALLDGINFSGSGDYVGSKSKSSKRSQALAIAASLDGYNNGSVC